MRVRLPHRQQAPSQRVCGRGWRECNHLASHPAFRERRQHELPRRDDREPRFASGWRALGARRGSAGLAAALPQKRFRALPLPARAHCPALPDGAATALPAVHCQTREDQSGGRITPRTSSGKIWQCLGSGWQCLAVLNPSQFCVFPELPLFGRSSIEAACTKSPNITSRKKRSPALPRVSDILHNSSLPDSCPPPVRSSSLFKLCFQI